MAFVWILTVISAILIIVGLGGFEFTWHALAGWFVILITLVTPFMAYFRPKNDAPNRKIFDIYHLISGITVHALAGN